MLLQNFLLIAGLSIMPCVLSDPAHIADIGQSCGSSSNLCPQFSGCVNQICQCNQGYAVAVDHRSCVPLVTEWEGSCTDSSQCQNFAGAVCKDNRCECELGHHFLEGKCWINRHLGDHCQESDECLLSPHQDRIECSNGLCTCKSGYIQSEDGSDCNGGSAVWSLGMVSVILIASVQMFFK
ncbi:multiple epidermal growth factor-like domains protein 6 [Ischnura elegans]|uniref:multiple epidermal growth factor-like domains protein 6 n=1 Tax=Ischnura elegans TaxID=197161 RepID=UPI001ED89B4B|nr:multiple epidermal growth factor-like domains protein 6 [Ischnura elegans]